MSEFSHFSDENVIDTYLVYRYSDEYNQILLEELKKRNIEIKNFDTDEGYITSFIRSFSKGWQREIKNMFEELRSLGWNKLMHIEAKEKWGRFHFSGGNLSLELSEVINKHKELINDTCSRCGSKDHVQENGADWIEILCRKCTQNDLKKLVIHEISEKGFIYYNIKSSNNVFLWQDVDSINLNFSEEVQSIGITMNRIVEIFYDVESKSLNFHLFRNLNFLKLLQSIPENLLSSSELEKRKHFLNSLKKCHFCEKKTVYSSSCLLCTESLDNILSGKRQQYLKFYNNIPEIIKEEKQSVQYYLEYWNTQNFFFKNDYFL